MLYHTKKPGAWTWQPYATDSLEADLVTGKIGSDWRIRAEGESHDYTPEELVAAEKTSRDRIAAEVRAARDLSANRMRDKYSTFWPRFWAGLVDGLLFLPWSSLHNWIFAHPSPIWLRAFAYILNTSAFLAYSILMHACFGQTLGKMVCKVIVRDISEQRLSMRQAVLRDILGVVLLPFSLATELPVVLRGENPFLPGHFTVATWILGSVGILWSLIELITMLANNKRRALHDFIARSVVIRTAYAPHQVNQP